MNARIHIQYEAPTPSDWDSLASVARSLTNDSKTVVVHEKGGGWLIADFTLPTEAQYKAVDRIDREIRFYLWRRMDSIIEFPRTPAEEEQARRRAERRRVRRRSRRVRRRSRRKEGGGQDGRTPPPLPPTAMGGQ